MSRPGTSQRRYAVPAAHSIACRCCSQALSTFGDEIGIAFSGAEDVALVEYAHLTGRPYRVFRRVPQSLSGCV